MDIKGINKLLDDGSSLEEIANKYSQNFCVVSFGLFNEDCNQNHSCHNCWKESLNRELLKKK